MDTPVPILIVDDEHLVRSGIRHLLRDQKEFLVAAEAANGQEALEKIGELGAAIVLMDVKMPVMDGLEALEKIRDCAPQVRTIILSGYSEFHFAQKALQLGASDYLLKPVSPAELVAVMRRVRVHLLEECRQKAAVEQVRQKLSYSLSAFMEQFYLQLLRGDLTPEEIAEKIRILGLEDPRGIVLLVGLDDTYRLKSRLVAEAFQDLSRRLRVLIEVRLAEMEAGAAPVVPVDEAAFAVIFPASLEAGPAELARGLLAEARRVLGQTVTVAIGSQRPLPQIRSSFEEARLRLRNRVLTGGDRVLKQDPRQGAGGGGYPEQLEKKLGKALRFGDGEQVRAILKDLLRKLRGNPLTLSDWHQLAFDIVELGYRNLRQLGFPPEQASFPLEKIRDIARLETLDDLSLWLEESLGRIVDLIRKSSAGPSLAVKKALSFIEDHYAEAIRLSGVAAQVCLSPNYLSQQFKLETGLTFLEHLSRRRIEEAKRLLLHSVLNISEIAYRVGYDNPRYFSEVFHRLEQVTPSQFREGRPGPGAEPQTRPDLVSQS